MRKPRRAPGWRVVYSGPVATTVPLRFAACAVGVVALGEGVGVGVGLGDGPPVAAQEYVVAPGAVCVHVYVVPEESVHVHDDGAGPVAPVAPGAPFWPFWPAGPWAPVAPIGPAGPVAPTGPAGPEAPVSPVAPVAPVLPSTPDDPVAPTAPGLPAGPVLPAAPWAPGTPCTISVAGGADGVTPWACSWARVCSSAADNCVIAVASAAVDWRA